jgi:hypothetical protein
MRVSSSSTTAVIGFRRHRSKPYNTLLLEFFRIHSERDAKNTRLIPILSKYADDTDLAWRRNVPDA